MLGQQLIRQYVYARRGRGWREILDQIYVQLEGIIIEEERRRIVARVHEIRNLLRARLEGGADSRASALDAARPEQVLRREGDG